MADILWEFLALFVHKDNVLLLYSLSLQLEQVSKELSGLEQRNKNLQDELRQEKSNNTRVDVYLVLECERVYTNCCKFFIDSEKTAQTTGHQGGLVLISHPNS